MPEFDFASNDELVAELMRRPTFRGIILHQADNFKGPPESGWLWRKSPSIDFHAMIGILFESTVKLSVGNKQST